MTIKFVKAEVSEKLHRKIKERAVQEGITMTELVGKCLMKELKYDQHGNELE